MKLPVVIDIETIPLAASLEAPYPRDERSHPSNYKDPEKIAAWYERDEKEWRANRVKECSLSPRLGRVVVLGFSLPCSDGPIDGAAIAETEDDEKSVLAKFWEIVGQHDGRVVTFNGRSFDLQFLVLRSLHHGITPTVSTDTIRAWFKRYQVKPHCDVRDLLTNWDDHREGTLSDWCRFLSIPYTNGHTGADVAELFASGKLHEIAHKCRDDVRATRSLYNQVARMFASEAA